jgi:hypothetical protein
MKAIPIRRRVKADASHTIHITLPPEIGDEVEVVILPASASAASLTDDEAFNLAAYAATTEADEQEDALWGKYVRG